MNLGKLRGVSGKADTVVTRITAVLIQFMKEYHYYCCGYYECEHWKKESDCHSVTMTVCVKETGRIICCQHHILHRVVPVVMDDELTGNNTSPNMEYHFNPKFVKSY